MKVIHIFRIAYGIHNRLLLFTTYTPTSQRNSGKIYARLSHSHCKSHKYLSILANSSTGSLDCVTHALFLRIFLTIPKIFFVLSGIYSIERYMHRGHQYFNHIHSRLPLRLIDYHLIVESIQIDRTHTQTHARALPTASSIDEG